MKHLNYSGLTALGISVCFAFSANSYAISHIGNSSFGDDEIGYVAPIAPEYCFESFCFATALSGGNLIFKLPPGGIIPGQSTNSRGPHLWAKDLAEEYPDLEGLSRTQWQERFLNPENTSLVWMSVPALNPCVEIVQGVSNGVMVGIASWGSKRGVVLVGPNDYLNRRAIPFSLNRIALQVGACQW